MFSILSSAGTVIITIFIFGVLITIHELGHYVAARLFKVGIREFSIGMGPAIHTWKCKTNDVSIRCLPIGGYVSMVGEMPGDEAQPEDAGKTGLNKKPIWQRMIVVLAGPFMNILLAFVIMTGNIILTPETEIGSTVIAVFDKDAITNYEGGLCAGDKIIEIDGTSVNVSSDLSYLIALRGKKPLDVKVIRDGKEVLVPKVQFPESVSGNIAMGDIDFKIYHVRKDFSEVLHQSFYQPISIIKMTVESLVRSIRGEYGWEAVSGPVGVGGQVHEVIEESNGIGETIKNLMLMAVLISVSLGVCNLLPLPVLDGGRFVLYIIEAIRRKPLNPKVEASINSAFMILLMGFMVFIAVKDVVGLF